MATSLTYAIKFVASMTKAKLLMRGRVFMRVVLELMEAWVRAWALITSSA